MTETCPICGQKIGMAKTKIADGEICSACASICSSPITKCIREICEYWKINEHRGNIFSTATKLESVFSTVVSIDLTNQLFVIGDIDKMEMMPIYYSFDDVDSYDLEIIGEETVTRKKGGITSAAFGGVINDPASALIERRTTHQKAQTSGDTPILKIYFDMYSGPRQVTVSNPPAGFTEFLDNCMILSEISYTPRTISTGVADEIMKFKSLLDQGIITQEEFNKKKTQLLSL